MNDSNFCSFACRIHNKAKRLSMLVNESYANVLDTTDWWMDFVLRHNGTKLLKYTRGKDLNFFQYHMIDIFVTLGALVIIFIVLLCYLLCLPYRKIAKVRLFVNFSVRTVISTVINLADRFPYRIKIVKKEKRE